MKNSLWKCIPLNAALLPLYPFEETCDESYEGGAQNNRYSVNQYNCEKTYGTDKIYIIPSFLSTLYKITALYYGYHRRNVLRVGFKLRLPHKYIWNVTFSLENVRKMSSSLFFLFIFGRKTTLFWEPFASKMESHEIS